MRSELGPDVDLVVIVRSALSGLKLADVVAEWAAAEERIMNQLNKAHGDRERRHGELPSAVKGGAPC